MRFGPLSLAIVVAACGSQGEDPIGPGPDAGGPTPVDAGAATPDAFSPTTWHPSSKGLWIWYFDYAGLTPTQVAELAVKDHIGYVLIKSGQDASFWSTRYTAAVLKEFTSRGIHVFAWPYITPANIPASIDAVVKAANVPGTDGIVLDVEIEFETGGNHAADAQALCQGIRAKAPGVWLGYTSFGWVGYHGPFPWKTFDQYCGDAFFPQVYWTDRGVTWSYGLTQALKMISDAGLKAPVWVIQSNDNTPSGGTASTADLNAFFDQAGIFSSLWELPAKASTAKLTQLDLLHWLN